MSGTGRMVGLTATGKENVPTTGDIIRRNYTKKKRNNYPLNTLEAGLPVFREAVPAIDGPSLSWLERYFAFLSTV